jgi:hypothetical protein
LLLVVALLPLACDGVGFDGVGMFLVIISSRGGRLLFAFFVPAFVTQLNATQM